MTDKSNLLFDLVDQENSKNLLGITSNLKNKIVDGEQQQEKIGTPRAKSVLSNRKVLAEKTPNNGKRKKRFDLLFINFFFKVKRPFSPTKSKSSPSLLSNSLNRTPLAHPSLKEIAATTKTLSNPPDLFLQPLQKRRSIQNDPKDRTETDTNKITSKLVVVFPTTSDELDFEEVEHSASALIDSEEEADIYLSGPSKVIPNLELHENLDFSALLERVVSTCDVANDCTVVIEPILVEFKLDEKQ